MVGGECGCQGRETLLSSARTPAGGLGHFCQMTRVVYEEF